MIKQFDLQYYLEHPDVKVVTRDGRNVKILCTDLRKKNYPIVAICICVSGDEDEVGTYTRKGEVVANTDLEYSRDLFFDLPDPEKKKVPLTYEDLLERVKSGKTMWLVCDQDTVYNIVDFDVDGVYYIYGDVDEIRNISYEALMNGITFADGTPCWKEVDSCDTCTNDKGCVTCNDGDQWEGGEK